MSYVLITHVMVTDSYIQLNINDSQDVLCIGSPDSLPLMHRMGQGYMQYMYHWYIASKLLSSAGKLPVDFKCQYLKDDLSKRKPFFALLNKKLNLGRLNTLLLRLFFFLKALKWFTNFLLVDILHLAKLMPCVQMFQIAALQVSQAVS